MTAVDREVLRLTVEESWERVFSEPSRGQIETALPAFLNRHRWFGGKGRLVAGTQIDEVIPVPAGPHPAVLAFIEVAYHEGLRETYVLPVTAAFGGEAERLAAERPLSVMAHVTVQSRSGAESGCLYDAASNQAVTHELLGLIREQRRCVGTVGALQGTRTAAFETIVGPGIPASKILRAEQSNTTIAFGDRAVLKL